jgi:hypothetical protein
MAILDLYCPEMMNLVQPKSSRRTDQLHSDCYSGSCSWQGVEDLQCPRNRFKIVPIFTAVQLLISVSSRSNSRRRRARTVSVCSSDFLTFSRSATRQPASKDDRSRGSGAVIVGHFFSLDLKFLDKEMKRLQRRKFRYPVADTLKAYEWMQDQSRGSRGQYDACVENKDLFSLANQYHIQVSAAHNALMDAFITAQLFQRFLSYLPALGVRTVKDLLRIAKP